MIWPAAIEHTPALTRRYDPEAEVARLGERAQRAVELAAAGKPWSPEVLWRAARALAAGDRSAGVHRPWPRLAAGLKRVAATWWVRKGQRL